MYDIISTIDQYLRISCTHQILHLFSDKNDLELYLQNNISFYSKIVHQLVFQFISVYYLNEEEIFDLILVSYIFSIKLCTDIQLKYPYTFLWNLIYSQTHYSRKKYHGFLSKMKNYEEMLLTLDFSFYIK